MIFNNVYDFGDISSLKLDGEIEGFQLRVDNFLAMTALDKERTIVLTVQGHLLLLRCTLSNCLKQFCDLYHIRSYEMDAYYQQVQCRTQGLIAGNYRLVPSQGASNPHVVYYNAHFLDAKYYSEDLQRVLIIFKTEDGYYQLQVGACFSSFVRILAAAEKVSAFQLKNLEEEMWRLGVKSEDKSSSDIFQCHRDALRFNDTIQSAVIHNVLATAFENSYGQKPDDDFSNSVTDIINN